MKLKPIQIFLVIYFILTFIKFIVKELYFSLYINLKPVFDGLIVATIAISILYYARIYITAWIRFKKEDRQKRTEA
ncbi:hypothetical protein HDF24_22700 [Mucilaginibacter sp. X4EP1]|uniref:hypothetical protein n=1 Tax=Mucilaginibacter sp. X4EP1 TaxID=2723092 RepID=UPI00216A9146|nr:hypothetical protein [Mucilaginibacter sp. X4EP1]MCS3816468.1 hypothetical protein [Mucilaginibacter sp. X4EP1]